LTATVKLYLKEPEEAEEMIHEVLEIATEKAESPDLKDRAYIYWRMLSTCPQKTKEVVLGKKPNIAHDCYNIYDEEFLGKLCD
jgi:AP-1 complex subunit beta-1